MDGLHICVGANVKTKYLTRQYLLAFNAQCAFLPKGIITKEDKVKNQDQIKSINKVLNSDNEWAFKYIMPFGQYKGEAVGDLALTNKTYLEYVEKLRQVDNKTRAAIRIVLG